MSSDSAETVGVTLVTGFLGSGKSTLIRRVLTENHQQRIVVVENEFGATAEIEQAIVTQGVGSSALEEFIELPNGCICCAAQDDLVDALTRLVEQKRGRFDHILVEASGLADPRPVAASFWVDAVADASLRLDAVVAVVDAATVEAAIKISDDGNSDNQKNDIALKQLAVADIVLLNKMDLVVPSSSLSNSSSNTNETAAAYVERITELIRAHGCFGRIIPTTRCDVEIRQLLNVRAYDSDVSFEALGAGAPEKFLHHAHGNEKPASTFTITFKNVQFSSVSLDRALGLLLWEQSNNEQDKDPTQQQQIWRMKALVIIDGEPFKWIYQSVHTLFDDMESSVKVENQEDMISHFLFIGHNMHQDSVQKCLEQAIVGSSS